MPVQQKRCFVVMGFGLKTDYATGRVLDLNKSYRLLIKPVVESKGLQCIRADEIIHSGTIDVPMYNELLRADVVIADLSTANVNAFYELGIRHALRPFTTVVISEDKMTYPFDLNHIRISGYTHLGNAIDFDEVERFRNVLGGILDQVLQQQEPDSPVYTFIDDLMPPALKLQKAALEGIPIAAPAVAAVRRNGAALPANGTEPPELPPAETPRALSIILEEAEEAIDNSNFALAKTLFASAVQIGNKGGETDAFVNNAYLLQRLAMTTYKAQLPDKVTALHEALRLLSERLDLEHTNDSETVSLAGAIEKKLYEAGEGIAHLDHAILYFQRGYYLLNNRYNGINLAFTLNCRAISSLATSKEEQIADMIYANHTRKRVLLLCEREWEGIIEREKKELSHTEDEAAREAQRAFNNDQKFWIQINRAEAYFGIGDFERFGEARQAAAAIEHSEWMMEAFDMQIDKLRKLLQASGHLLNPAWAEP